MLPQQRWPTVFFAFIFYSCKYSGFVPNFVGRNLPHTSYSMMTLKAIFTWRRGCIGGIHVPTPYYPPFLPNPKPKLYIFK